MSRRKGELIYLSPYEKEILQRLADERDCSKSELLRLVIVQADHQDIIKLPPRSRIRELATG